MPYPYQQGHPHYDGAAHKEALEADDAKRIEAAAAAIYTAMYGNDLSMPGWSLTGDGCRDRFRTYASAALEAAHSV